MNDDTNLTLQKIMEGDEFIILPFWVGVMSIQEVTRWQHNHISHHPYHTHKSLIVYVTVLKSVALIFSN